MSRTLYLVRHAEALSASVNQKDFDRDLTGNGYSNVTRMGRHLFESGVNPNMILSSKALRAERTAITLAEQLRYDTEKILWSDEIYDASVRTLLKVVTELKVEWKTVLIVAHNPTVSYLAEYITGADIGDIVTCGVVQIDFDLGSWHEAGEDSGTFARYFEPFRIETS